MACRHRKLAHSTSPPSPRRAGWTVIQSGWRGAPRRPRAMSARPRRGRRRGDRPIDAACHAFAGETVLTHPAPAHPPPAQRVTFAPCGEHLGRRLGQATRERPQQLREQRLHVLRAASEGGGRPPQLLGQALELDGHVDTDPQDGPLFLRAPLDKNSCELGQAPVGARHDDVVGPLDPRLGTERVTGRDGGDQRQQSRRGAVAAQRRTSDISSELPAGTTRSDPGVPCPRSARLRSRAFRAARRPGPARGPFRWSSRSAGGAGADARGTSRAGDCDLNVCPGGTRRHGRRSSSSAAEPRFTARASIPRPSW